MGITENSFHYDPDPDQIMRLTWLAAATPKILHIRVSG